MCPLYKGCFRSKINKKESIIQPHIEPLMDRLGYPLFGKMIYLDISKKSKSSTLYQITSH